MAWAVVSSSLRVSVPACYGFDLAGRATMPRIAFNPIVTTFRVFCHVFLLILLVSSGLAQEKPLSSASPALARGEVLISAPYQEVEGRLYRLRGGVELRTAEAVIRADQIDYNEETGEAVAEGHVRYQNLVGGERLEARRVEYNLRNQMGKFYDVRGEATTKMQPRPGVLFTENPFVFQGKWAERVEERYILHDGFLTNCRLPNPVWTLHGSKFDIIPDRRALVHSSKFRVRKIPLFYFPVFYKPLEERPRKSGFLTPNAGNSSRRGYMAGLGYYWAIDRSYDLMYRTQYFTQRGLAHHVDFRGKPTQRSDFYVFVYGVNDKGLDLGGGNRLKASGMLLTATGDADLGRGFVAKADVNYLSSFLFRQEFTESFNEAVFSEVHSTAYVTRNWSSFGLNAVYRQGENFHSTREGDVISIRKLPAVEFRVRDREVSRRTLPVWVSLDSSFGLLRRNQPLFQTRKFVERTDLAPRVMTALRWKEFHLLPAVTFRGTHYDSSWREGRISGDGVFRGAVEFSFDLALPSLARTFSGPRRFGERFKHVVETNAAFRRRAGVGDFHRFILFDTADLVSNTTEADLTVVNRLYAKRQGGVTELLSWQLWQRYFFDPDFGGAVLEGRRNVVLSSIEMTGYAFLDRPRSYSPVVSVVRVGPETGLGLNWRSDYDPLRHRFVNSGLTADGRFGKYWVSLGHNLVRSDPVLTAQANQFRGMLAVGDPNKRGWNAAFSAIYDFRSETMQFATTQVTYNSDCCGISVQYRRFSFGTRNENQFRVAFAIANIGSFGTLRRQERLF
jgi:LPS-assembly protein